MTNCLAVEFLNLISAMGEHPEQPLCKLVVDDKFYQEVRARLEDPNERDDGGRTLLHLAAWSLDDNSKIFQLLLDRGADVNAVTPYGYTPLHFAVCIKKRRNIVALLEAGASVNSKDSLGRTALHFAVIKKWSSSPSPILLLGYDRWTVQKLLSHPEINPNPANQMGETPLIWATREKNPDAVGALLKKGADPNIAKNDRRTALHVALLALKPSYNVVKLLLTNGAGIYCKDASRERPIDILIRLIRGISDHRSLQFASRCVELVALRYQIRESLKLQSKKIPWLSEYLNECCRRVRLMRKVRVHAKFTVHDFALNLFQARVENPVRTIYTPLVEAMLTGLFKNYFALILFYIPPKDLRRVLERTVGRKTAGNLAPEDASIFDMYEAIRQYYDENEVLKDRVLKYRKFLMTKM